MYSLCGHAGFSSEFQSSFGRGGGSNHPPAKEDTPVDDEWLLYHCHLKDTIRAASCKISKQVIQEAHLASELILASLPSPLKSSSPRQRRHGSDAGVSSTTSSRKSSILASRDSLLVPGNQQRRASSERWTRGDSFAVVLDKENEKALQLLGRACSLICKHGHLLLATDASSDQHERRKWFALCQHAGLLCVGKLVAEDTLLLEVLCLKYANLTKCMTGIGTGNLVFEVH